MQGVQLKLRVIQRFEPVAKHTLSNSSTAGLISSFGRIRPPFSDPVVFPRAGSPDEAGLGAAGLAAAGLGAGLGAGAGAGAVAWTEREIHGKENY